jgi:hypothetical protein
VGEQGRFLLLLGELVGEGGFNGVDGGRLGLGDGLQLMLLGCF